MSTPCLIAVKFDESNYSTIYCHHDGYKSYMLPMLQNNYNSEKLARKLISFGDASAIRKKLEPASLLHSFEQPEADVSIFYHRDRGEPWVDNAPALMTKQLLVNQYRPAYIFENDHWTAYGEDA